MESSHHQLKHTHKQKHKHPYRVTQTNTPSKRRVTIIYVSAVGGGGSQSSVSFARLNLWASFPFSHNYCKVPIHLNTPTHMHTVSNLNPSRSNTIK